MTGRTRLVLIHGFDPRGSKVGGIESHVRQLLRLYPADMDVLMVGLDDSGALALGEVHRVTVAGRPFDFLPVLHVPAERQIGAARRLRESVTLRFAAAVARHLPRLRRLLAGECAVAEVERFEFAPLARLAGCPLVLVAHNEGDPRIDPMDSILTRYWWLNAATERLAVRLAGRVYGVTPRVRDRLAERYRSQSDKLDVLSVSVDTALFEPTPFDTTDGILRLLYAGRLDAFKDPPLMFAVAAALRAALGGRFEFHYYGSADPERFPEFAAIRAVTIRHGAQDTLGIAAAMRHAHMGILVSHWEGLPVFLLELLASGRPFVGLRLPQFVPLVEPGVSGRMAERAATQAETVAAIVPLVLAQWEDIRAGRTDPAAISAKVLPWSVDQQLGRLFAAQRRLARPIRP